MDHATILEAFPPTPPTARLIWTAVVEVGTPVDLGPSPGGQRTLVPIVGGRFFAGPGMGDLNGVVCQGGADRQVLRPDGVKLLDALYEMQTECGARLTIRNRVVVDPARKPERYAMSTLSVIAPEGPFDWLNRRLLIGTLQSARPTEPAVVVRAWEADTTPSAFK